MMRALWEVLAGFATLVALGFLVWTVANVIEGRRYLARVRRRNQPWFAVKVRVIRPWRRA